MKQNVSPNKIDHFYEFKPDNIIITGGENYNSIQDSVGILGSDPHLVAISIIIKALWASVSPFVKWEKESDNLLKQRQI